MFDPSKNQFINRLINQVKQRLTLMLGARYTNRWLILVIDLIISAFAFIFSFWVMRSTYQLHVSALVPFYLVIFYLVFCSVAYLAVGLHHGVIRYSSYHEIGRIIVSVFSSNLFLLVFIHFVYPHYNDPIIFSFLLKTGLFTFFGLVIFRYVIFRLYQWISTDASNHLRTTGLMYGTNPDSVAIALMLNNNPHSSCKINGFVTANNESENQRIIELPIIRIGKEALHTVIRTHKVTSLVFSSQDDLQSEKEHLVQAAIELKMQILLARSPKIWTEKKIDGFDHHAIRSVQIEDLLGRSEINIDMEKISNEMSGRIILVTGAAGSIGSEIVRQVAAFNPKRLILLDIAETPLYDIENEIREKFENLDLVPLLGDVRRPDCLDVVFEEYHPEIIYHAAAYKHVPMMERHPAEAILTNVLGTQQMADYAVKFHALKFVMISTDKAVNPSNVMGASKRIAEMYVQSKANAQNQTAHTVQFITTRFGNVLGSNGSVIPRFKTQIEAGGPVTVTDPNIIRYFMTIPEACRLVLEASVHGQNGEIYIFDMGDPVKIDDLARNMIRLAGLIPDQDIQIKYIGLRPGEKLYEEILNDREKTLPTHHPKIKVAKVSISQFDNVSNAVHELIETARTMKPLSIVKQMKQLVPEYKSLHSEFEKLDHIDSQKIENQCSV
ncbi:MAG: polysaccharide biosynthesis protein [Microbacter sp.]